MRVWVAGQFALALDAFLVAAVSFAMSASASHDLRVRGLLVLGAIVGFLLPAGLALRLGDLRRRPWFWLATSLPALGWIPAMPWVLLRTGPSLASTAGLALAALGLVAAVLTLVSGLLAAVDARSHRRGSSDQRAPRYP